MWKETWQGGSPSRGSGLSFPAAWLATMAEVITLHLLCDPTSLLCLLERTGHLGVAVQACDPSTHKVETEGVTLSYIASSKLDWAT